MPCLRCSHRSTGRIVHQGMQTGPVQEGRAAAGDGADVTHKATHIHTSVHVIRSESRCSTAAGRASCRMTRSGCRGTAPCAPLTATPRSAAPCPSGTHPPGSHPAAEISHMDVHASQVGTLYTRQAAAPKIRQHVICRKDCKPLSVGKISCADTFTTLLGASTLGECAGAAHLSSGPPAGGVHEHVALRGRAVLWAAQENLRGPIELPEISF